jgi:hypothetical protein
MTIPKRLIVGTLPIIMGQREDQTVGRELIALRTCSQASGVMPALDGAHGQRAARSDGT